MHDWHDWAKDIGLPLLTGGGSVVVGVGAIYVARRSHRLAEQVREDEAKREAAASSERYRDQLFRVVEPALTAMLAHRAEVQSSQRVGYTAEGHLRSEVVSRLFLTRTVATSEDAKLVDALRKALDDALATTKAQVTVYVLGQMVLGVSMLLNDARDIDAEVAHAGTWVTDGEDRYRESNPPQRSTASSANE